MSHFPRIHSPGVVLLPAAMALALMLLSGCSWGHRGAKAGCKEPVIGAEARNLPPLSVPPGKDAPDTRNSIKIPALTEPERPRLPSEPCLSRPPTFKSQAP
jgi:uncharacterized lipoprotein